jgi:hypothetical protein
MPYHFNENAKKAARLRLSSAERQGFEPALHYSYYQ